MTSPPRCRCSVSIPTAGGSTSTGSRAPQWHRPWLDQGMQMTAPSPLDPPASQTPWIERINELAADFARRAAEFDETAQLPVENLRRLHEAGFDTAWLPQSRG